MIQIEQTLLSESLFEEDFVCNLSACKGACCVEGDSGAPLTMAEIDQLEAEVEQILPLIPVKSRQRIRETGVFIVDQDGDYVTPLNDGKECAFTVFEENGTAKCGIELAHNAGKTSLLKPISCHLYPIRISKLHDHDALNYNQWDICSPACKLGKELKVKVYQFLKTPLVRKYGEDWYQQLEEVDQLLSKDNN